MTPYNIVEVEMEDGSVAELEIYDDYSEEELIPLLEQFRSSYVPQDEMPKGEYSVDNKRFSQYVNPILEAEGGYVDDPDDSGGATNFGITIGTLSKWRGSDVTKEDVRNLKVDEAIEIYKNEYYYGPRINEIGLDKVEEMVLDHSINAGPKSGIKLLQRVVGATQDGQMGPNTLKALASYIEANGEQKFLKDYAAKRKDFYKAVVKNNPKNNKFLKGWNNRVDNQLSRLLDNSSTEVAMIEEGNKT